MSGLTDIFGVLERITDFKEDTPDHQLAGWAGGVRVNTGFASVHFA